MPSSMNWVDGAAGGTPVSATNLNKLAVTADIGTAGTPTGDALRAAYGALPKVAATVTAAGALVVNKHNPVDATSAALTMTLPTGQSEGTQISVEKTDAGTNAVAVTGSIRGVGSTTISLVWQNEELLFRADSAGSWWPISGHKTKATLDAAYRTRLTATRVTQGLPRPIAGHPLFIGSFATDAGRSSRIKHVLTTDCTDLTLVYGNWGSQDAEPNSPIKVRAGIEYPSGTFYKIHFPGEDVNRDVTIMPGGMVASMPLTHLPLKAGTTFWTNTLVVPVNAGGQYPVGGSVAGSASTDERVAVNTATDYTTATNPGNVAIQFAYSPLYVGGTSTGALKTTFSVIGDSISIGVGDALVNNTYENGFIARALNAAGLAYVNLGLNGEKTNNWSGKITDPVGAARCRYRSMLIGPTDVAIIEHGTNDMVSTAFAALQTAIIAEWSTVGARNVGLWQTTITPQTTSTDSWATTVNQTAKSANFGPEGAGRSVRQLFNGWLRDGAPLNVPAMTAAATGSSGAGIVRAGQAGHLLLGVADTAAAVEVYEPTSDTWVYQPSAGTTDGIHPGAAGHTAMATRLRTALGI